MTPNPFNLNTCLLTAAVYGYLFAPIQGFAEANLNIGKAMMPEAVFHVLEVSRRHRRMSWPNDKGPEIYLRQWPRKKHLEQRSTAINNRPGSRSDRNRVIPFDGRS